MEELILRDIFKRIESATVFGVLGFFFSVICIVAFMVYLILKEGKDE